MILRKMSNILSAYTYSCPFNYSYLFHLQCHFSCQQLLISILDDFKELSNILSTCTYHCLFYSSYLFHLVLFSCCHDLSTVAIILFGIHKYTQCLVGFCWHTESFKLIQWIQWTNWRLQSKCRDLTYLNPQTNRQSSK